MTTEITHINADIIALTIVSGGNNPTTGEPVWFYEDHTESTPYIITSDTTITDEITPGSGITTVTVKVTAPASYEIGGQTPTNGWIPSDWTSSHLEYQVDFEVDHEFTIRVRPSGDQGNGIKADPTFKLKKTTGG